MKYWEFNKLILDLVVVFTVTGKQLQNCNIRRFPLVIMALRPALVISHTHSPSRPLIVRPRTRAVYRFSVARFYSSLSRASWPVLPNILTERQGFCQWRGRFEDMFSPDWWRPVYSMAVLVWWSNNWVFVETTPSRLIHTQPTLTTVHSQS